MATSTRQLSTKSDGLAVHLGWAILELAHRCLGGPTHGETYFDAANDAVLGCLFVDAESDEEYLTRLEDFMSGTDTTSSR